MRRARSSSQLQGWLFMGPALLFVAVFVLLPLGQLIATSLSDKSLLGGGRFIGFDNYLRIWRDAGFWRALEFTAKYTIILTPILMGLGYLLALLTVEGAPLKRLTRTIIFLPVVIGLSSSSLMWYWLLDEQVGLFNKLLVDLHVIKEPIVWFITADLAFSAVVISITWKVVGFGMVLFVSGIQSINPDILEAAVMDGAPLLEPGSPHHSAADKAGLAADDAGQRHRVDARLRPVLHHDLGRAARADVYRGVLDLSEFICFVQARLRLGAVGRADADHSRVLGDADRVDRAQRGDMSALPIATDARTRGAAATGAASRLPLFSSPRLASR